MTRVWDRLLLDPEFPENLEPFMPGLDASAGIYERDFYGSADVSRNGEGLVLTLHGPGGWQTYSTEMLYWDGELLDSQWSDPDNAPELVRFLGR